MNYSYIIRSIEAIMLILLIIAWIQFLIIYRRNRAAAKRGCEFVQAKDLQPGDKILIVWKQTQETGDTNPEFDRFDVLGVKGSSLMCAAGLDGYIGEFTFGYLNARAVSIWRYHSTAAQTKKKGPYRPSACTRQ